MFLYQVMRKQAVEMLFLAPEYPNYFPRLVFFTDNALCGNKRYMSHNNLLCYLTFVACFLRGLSAWWQSVFCVKNFISAEKCDSLLSGNWRRITYCVLEFLQRCCLMIFADILPCSRKTREGLKFLNLWTLSTVSIQGLTLNMGNTWGFRRSGWASSFLIKSRNNAENPWWTPPLSRTFNPSRYAEKNP